MTATDSARAAVRRRHGHQDPLRPQAARRDPRRSPRSLTPRRLRAGGRRSRHAGVLRRPPRDAEYYLGLARQMGGEFFRSAPKLKLVQLLSAGYDRVDIEAARKAERARVQQRRRQRHRGGRAHAHADAGRAQAGGAVPQRRGGGQVAGGRLRPTRASTSCRGRTLGIVGPRQHRQEGRAARRGLRHDACSTTTSRASPRPRRTRSACASCCFPSCCGPPTWSACTCRSTTPRAT